MEEKYIVLKNNRYAKIICDSPEQAREQSKYWSNSGRKHSYAPMSILVPEGSQIYKEHHYGTYKVKSFSPLYEEKSEILHKLTTELESLKRKHGIYDLEEKVEKAQKEVKNEITVAELTEMFMRRL